MNKISIIALLVCILIFFGAGCGFDAPRPRLGCYPTSTPGSAFVSSNKLGQHSYFYSPFEKNGITYTQKAGHIDITHLRIVADHTKYIAAKLNKTLLGGKIEFSFSQTADWSIHTIQIQYPQNWHLLKTKQKKQIADDVSLQLGQYLAFSASTWHEMLTWFGYKSMGIFSEQPSAFSCEDIYSNLLGTRVAALALQDKSHSYDKAVTLELKKQLQQLGGLSAKQARQASEMVRGSWFDGNIIVSMKKRNLDIGLDNGYVLPMIVPEFCPQAKPKPLPVPNADLSRYGFSIEYAIHPREIEKNSILDIVHPDGKGNTIIPAIHFQPILAHIRHAAIEKYGPLVATPYDPDRIKQNTTQLASDSKSKQKNPTSIEKSLQALMIML